MKETLRIHAEVGFRQFLATRIARDMDAAIHPMYKRLGRIYRQLDARFRSVPPRDASDADLAEVI